MSVASKTRACSPQVLVFLQALLVSKKHRGEQEATTLLKEAAELHFSSMQALPMSSEYLERLDPIFLVCIAKEYLVFCPKQVRGGCFFVGWGAGVGLVNRSGQRQDLPGQSLGCLSLGQLGNPVLFTFAQATCQSPRKWGTTLHLPGDADAAVQGLHVRSGALASVHPREELGSLFSQCLLRSIFVFACLSGLPRQSRVPVGNDRILHALISPKCLAPHSSTLAWEIPWTEEPGKLQSMGSLRVGHD